MKATLQGAIRSKTVWLNVFLGVLSAVELSGSHLTTLFGTQVAAAVLLVGSMANLALRAYTTSSLADKVDG